MNTKQVTVALANQLLGHPRSLYRSPWDYRAPEVSEDTDNECRFEIRHWGAWENPDDARHEQDYDWQVLSESSRKQLKAMLDTFHKAHPEFEATCQTEEKNWLVVTVRRKQTP
jgi:hypothetical protein